MISNFQNCSNIILGSSIALPANGLGGSRATNKIKAPQKNRAKPEKQKGKKEGGWGEGIFTLLRLRLERFRFSLIKRKPKQKIFHLLLKEKNGGQKKIKNVMKKFLFWFAVAKRRQAETHLIILDFVQKRFELHSENTANFHFLRNRKRLPRRKAPRHDTFPQF
jgi:hypothetical protein